MNASFTNDPESIADGIAHLRHRSARLPPLNGMIPTESREEWIRLHHALGQALLRYAGRVRQNGDVEELTPEMDVEAYAARQQVTFNPGGAAPFFAEAVAAHRAALAALDRKKEAARWAEEQRMIGETLAESAAGSGREIELLGEAIAAYQAGLKACGIKKDPLIWAGLKTSLAIAWQWRFCCEDGDDADAQYDQIEAAADCYWDTLKVYTMEEHPQQHYCALANIAGLLMELGMRDEGENRQLLWDDALSHAEAALTHPVYAQTGDRWGTVKRNLTKIRRLLRWAV